MVTLSDGYTSAYPRRIEATVDRRSEREVGTDRPRWIAWTIAAFVVALLTRGAIGLLHHNSCTGVPNFGEPVAGTARAGFCSTFDHAWTVAGLAFLLTLTGVAVARRRASWGAAVCIAVVVAVVAIAVVGAQLEAIPADSHL